MPEGRGVLGTLLFPEGRPPGLGPGRRRRAGQPPSSASKPLPLRIQLLVQCHLRGYGDSAALSAGAGTLSPRVQGLKPRPLTAEGIRFRLESA